MQIKSFIFYILTFISSFPLFAQLGSTHYLPPLHARVPITNATIYISTPSPTPINVSISRGDGTLLTTLTISQGNPALYEINVGANSPIIANFSELNTPTSNKGIKLEASELFYASLRTYTTNHAGYLTLKGEDALGTSFRLGSAPLDPFNTSLNVYTSIIATEDNTIVTFSDYNTSMIFQNGLTPTQILNEGETLTVSAYSGPNQNTEGFIGALLTSDKPVVVNTGNLRGNLPNTDPRSANWSDHMIDQIVDQSIVGFEYLLIRGGGNDTLERPMVISNQDNTEIFVNGVSTGIILNTGEYSFIDSNLYLPNDSSIHRNMYITTNDDTKTLYVYQFIGGRSGANTDTSVPDATPGMNFIPPLNCFFQQTVDLIPLVDEIYPGNFENYQGNILITSGIGSTVSINGVELDPSAALQNPGTTEWETYFVPNIEGNAQIISDGPLAAGIYGTDNQSAGFAGYYSGFAVTPEDTETEVCIDGGPIDLLERFNGNPPDGGTWTPPLDSGTNIFDPLTDPISNPSLTYNYEQMDECAATSVNITITLINNPQIDIIEDIEACETFTLQDPSTLLGNFLNNPQYYTATQSDPSTTIVDWTLPITESTTLFIYDENEGEQETCPYEQEFTIIINTDDIPIIEEPIGLCDDIGDLTDGITSIDLDTLSETLFFNILDTSTYTITWHPEEIDAIDNLSILTSPYIVSNNEDLYARIENTTTGCINIRLVIFNVSSRPAIFSPEEIIICAENPGINIEPVQDSTIFDLTIQSNIISGGVTDIIVDYYISESDALATENAIENPSSFINTSNPQTIYARTTDISTDLNCESLDIISFDIFVQPLPYSDLTDEGREICVDEITGIVLSSFELDGSVENPETGVIYNYEWTRRDVDQTNESSDDPIISNVATVTIDQPATYQVNITAIHQDGTECSYSASASYPAQSAPIFEAIVVEGSFNNRGLYTVEITITGGANPDSIYEFAIDDGPFQLSTTFTDVRPGDHTVFGRLANGECTTTQQEIRIIDYPRFFTPNQDGYNDTWNIINIDESPNLNAKIYIFDRYGKLLKQLSPLGPGWDGTFNGQPMPSSAYWFRVEFTELDENGTQRTVNGHFTLKR